MSLFSLSILIPAYNEEKIIVSTLDNVKKLPYLEEIIVVDDGSQDATNLLAKRAGAKVITLAQNRGKGAALNRGIKEVHANTILLLDADLGATAGEAAKLLFPLWQKEADMTIAKFPPRKRKSGFGLVKGTASWGIKMMTGLVLEEPLSGQRALTKSVLERIKDFRSGFGVEVGLTIDVAQAGLRILEVETEMAHAVTNRNLAGFWHRGKQFCHVSKALWNIWKER